MMIPSPHLHVALCEIVVFCGRQLLIRFSPITFFFFLADKRADQHLHDPDRGAGQPSEWQRHAHAADKSLHASGGELHWKVPTMHHGGLYDVSHHQVIWTQVRLTWTCVRPCKVWELGKCPEKGENDTDWNIVDSGMMQIDWFIPQLIRLALLIIKVLLNVAFLKINIVVIFYKLSCQYWTLT